MDQNAERTLVTLSNASDLVARVVLEVAGKDIAESINGSPLTLAAVQSLALAKINNNLENKIGVK